MGKDLECLLKKPNLIKVLFLTIVVYINLAEASKISLSAGL